VALLSMIKIVDGSALRDKDIGSIRL